MCFCQLIRIPMTKPHLWKLNFCIVTKGSGFFKQKTNKQKKLDLKKSCIFSNNFRPIDYLCTFNNDEFEIHYKDIYPDEVDLTKENEDTCKASFLNLSLEVLDRTFTSKLIDNRYAFPLYTNHTYYSDSNIPSKIFYTLVSSEILCTTTNLMNMVTNVNPLLLLKKKQDSEFTQIISFLKKIFGKHFDNNLITRNLPGIKITSKR